jgi:hypothetical protein
VLEVNSGLDVFRRILLQIGGTKIAARIAPGCAYFVVAPGREACPLARNLMARSARGGWRLLGAAFLTR